MFISVLASFFISVFIFNQANYPLTPPAVGFSMPKNFLSRFNPSTENLRGFLSDQGRVLGAVEAGIFESRGMLPSGPDKPLGPQRLPQSSDFKVTARSAVAESCDDGFAFFTHEPDRVAPIASLTKLMTSLVFLEYNPGWETIYEIKKEDRREGGRIYLFLGEKVTVKDLFHLSLVASDNTATIALVRSTGLSEEEFVKKMNEKAIGLGLSKTKFSDPVGLNNDNVSTASEMVKLAKNALAEEDIRQATLTKDYQFKTLNGTQKYVSSTDYLLKNFPNNGLKIIGGKTGYTDVAGYCFVGEFIDQAGRKIMTVILGGNSSDERFQETKDLAEWVFSSFAWQES